MKLVRDPLYPCVEFIQVFKLTGPVVYTPGIES